MWMDKLLFTGILALLVLVVATFFVFVANMDQSLSAIALGWIVAILALQMGKVIRGH
ncbi:MAG: hypothetical protein M1343_10985 [Chloroflexi bacterium]|nr:hypothetical protein [Chloroflexota bacterium]MDA8187007.1 hypothetical protein [Dehalococcoidales bacterium]